MQEVDVEDDDDDDDSMDNETTEGDDQVIFLAEILHKNLRENCSFLARFQNITKLHYICVNIIIKCTAHIVILFRFYFENEFFVCRQY